MTTTLSPPAEAAKPGRGSRGKPRGTLIINGLPQVNLLPPEVKAARGLKVVKRLLALGLVLVVGLIALAYAGALIARSDAETALAEAQAETARLRAEEQRYAEVPLVLGALDNTLAARELGMSTEVLWKEHLDAVTAVLPENVSIETLTLTGATPMALPAPPASPLYAESVAELTFSGRTATVPDTAAWIDALNSIPGFSDAWVRAAEVQAEDGSVYYAVDSSVRVLQSAYAQRFVATEEN